MHTFSCLQTVVQSMHTVWMWLQEQKQLQIVPNDCILGATIVWVRTYSKLPSYGPIVRSDSNISPESPHHFELCIILALCFPFPTAWKFCAIPVAHPSFAAPLTNPRPRTNPLQFQQSYPPMAHSYPSIHFLFFSLTLCELPFPALGSSPSSVLPPCPSVAAPSCHHGGRRFPSCPRPLQPRSSYWNKDPLTLLE